MKATLGLRASGARLIRFFFLPRFFSFLRALSPKFARLALSFAFLVRFLTLFVLTDFAEE
jgi:hypothetical protein